MTEQERLEAEWAKYRSEAQWIKDEPRWHFVLATYWQLDYEQIVLILGRSKTLDEAVQVAERVRDGMIAS